MHQNFFFKLLIYFNYFLNPLKLYMIYYLSDKIFIDKMLPTPNNKKGNV